MVVLTVVQERRQEVCADCGERIGVLFLALPSLGLFLHPRCGSAIGRRLQDEAEEAFLLSAQDSFSPGGRAHRP
jgi:hypothetical protein